MRIFRITDYPSGKTHVNFVDDNNVFVGYETDAECCGIPGWALTRTPEVKLYDNEDDLIEHVGFDFDTTFFEEKDSGDLKASNGDWGTLLFFRLTRGKEEIFLVLWNYHNGYYKNGFTMKKENEVLRKGEI